MMPYVGITGFMEPREASETMKEIACDAERLVMIGVLASSKTLRGIKNRWPNRYPEVDKIENIFLDHPRAFNLIHYNTDEPDNLYDQLSALTYFGGRNLHGFQLNIAWPCVHSLRGYRRRHAFMQIVLQVGGRAFDMVDHSPKQLAAKVAEYEGLADYLLLDPSGGFGKPFDPERAKDYLSALQAKKLNMGLGVAGGLSPTTLDLLEPLVKDFPYLSIDAEGRLRTPPPGDHLDVDLAKSYLYKALAMFGC